MNIVSVPNLKTFNLFFGFRVGVEEQELEEACYGPATLCHFSLLVCCWNFLFVAVLSMCFQLYICSFLLVYLFFPSTNLLHKFEEVMLLISEARCALWFLYLFQFLKFVS